MRVALAIGMLAVLLGLPGGRPASPGDDVRGEAVYAANCAVCHGVRGDGAGPAARMFRSRPRDFRLGLFKFRSTASGSLPTDADLRRTVAEGVRWTGMVARADLADADLQAVLRYLKTFAPRFAAERPGPVVPIPPAPASGPGAVVLGRRVYEEAGCRSCHGEQGRGDGPSAAGLHDDWGWPTWPSDLAWRPLKRGSTPEATYLTIATGLSGTPMPSYGDALDGPAIWALVHYLETLVPAGRRLSPRLALGEERRGWMALRMSAMGPMAGAPMMGRRGPPR